MERAEDAKNIENEQKQEDERREPRNRTPDKTSLGSDREKSKVSCACEGCDPPDELLFLMRQNATFRDIGG